MHEKVDKITKLVIIFKKKINSKFLCSFQNINETRPFGKKDNK